MGDGKRVTKWEMTGDGMTRWKTMGEGKRVTKWKTMGEGKRENKWKIMGEGKSGNKNWEVESTTVAASYTDDEALQLQKSSLRGVCPLRLFALFSSSFFISSFLKGLSIVICDG